MKAPEPSGITPLLHDQGAPTFDEPWQAQVLALAYDLAEKGMFSPAQWSDTLGDELRRAEAGGKPDTGQTYYEAALIALERLVAANSAVAGDDLSERIEAWRRAYLATPHGQPVELGAGLNR